jgi:tRNA(Ile)-lysidine synthase
MMIKSFKRFIEEHSLIPPRSKILLAVSGGVDSMVMLRLFKKCGYNFAVAHCNFQLRGNESDDDEQLVRNTCQQEAIRLYVKNFDTKAYALENKVSIQVAARELRYAWFDELRDMHNFSAVAVAHNKNDISETLLFNLARGTGLKGLSGIKPNTNGIIRPLLFALRMEIEEFAIANSIAFRNDSSNSQTKYARNRIRHNVLPELEKINEGAIDNIYRTSLFVANSWQAIEKMNSTFRDEVRSEAGDEVNLSISRLKAYPFRQIFLVEELTTFGFSPAMVLDIEKSIFSQAGKMFFAKDYQIVRDRDSLIISPLKFSSKPAEIVIDKETTIISNPFPLKFEVVNRKGFQIPKSSNVGVFNLDLLTFPLVLRPWREGDWFIPFGMKGRKKISDFLTDQKIPLHQKASVFVLESDGNIIWVVGHRIDNRFGIDNDCEKVLVVKMG